MYAQISGGKVSNEETCRFVVSMVTKHYSLVSISCWLLSQGIGVTILDCRSTTTESIDFFEDYIRRRTGLEFDFDLTTHLIANFLGAFSCFKFSFVVIHYKVLPSCMTRDNSAVCGGALCDFSVVYLG